MTLMMFLLAVIFLLFGYFIMDKIDQFSARYILPLKENPTEFSESISSKQKAILIQGDSGLTQQAIAYCVSQNYQYETIAEYKDISNHYQYIGLLALSFSDMDNIVLGSIGLKVYCIPHILTLCNTPTNLKIYNEFKFEQVMFVNIEHDLLLNNIKDFIQNVNISKGPVNSQ